MTIKRTFLFFILAFFIKATLVSAGVRPRIMTNPIIIDDIVASGGAMGVICDWEENLVAASVPSVTKGLFVPINTNTTNKEHYVVRINNIVCFKIGVQGSEVIGIDPLNAKITFKDIEATVFSNLDKPFSFKIRVRPVENGIELYNESLGSINQIVEVYKKTHACKIDSRWNPRLRSFPNPTIDIASLGFHLPMQATINLFIYDSTGNVIYQNKNYQAQESYNQIRVDISAHRANLYNAVLEILQPNGSVLSRKTCIIQKI